MNDLPDLIFLRILTETFETRTQFLAADKSTFVFVEQGEYFSKLCKLVFVTCISNGNCYS